MGKADEPAKSASRRYFRSISTTVHERKRLPWLPDWYTNCKISYWIDVVTRYCQLVDSVSEDDSEMDGNEENRTENSIVLQHGQYESGGEKGDHSGTHATEQSDVTDVDSMLFSQIAHFVGR